MSDQDLFDSSICEAVALGSCVMIRESQICYAGPLQCSPDAAGKMVLLHPDDFAKLHNHVNQRRH
jgi:hypothetical protein